MKPLSIYIHIPFCKSKCYYCDFLSAVPHSNEEQSNYVTALLREIEIEAVAYQDYEIRTIFIGGGTPSVLSVEELEVILCKLKKTFIFASEADIEVTIEINPGTVTSVILSKYKELGINRLSFGLQSTKNKELRILGRIHSFEEFLSTYHEARKIGFKNINIDLISAVPEQSLTSWQETLSIISTLNPEHISAYSLIIEPGTAFYEKYVSRNGKAIEIADEETERQIYHYTKEYLETNNYKRYEISNYSKPGYECKHNIVYWRRGDYVGFGLGAASMVSNKRWSNITDIESYIMIYQNEEINKSGKNTSILKKNASAKEKTQLLSLREQIAEFMFLGLRLTEGVNRVRFKELFGKDIDEIYGTTLEKLEAGQLINNGCNVSLTSYGVDVSNYVMAEFLLD